jgi:hypothetical protein
MDNRFSIAAFLVWLGWVIVAAFLLSKLQRKTGGRWQMAEGKKGKKNFNCGRKPTLKKFLF